MKRWILGLVAALGLSLAGSSAMAHHPHGCGHYGYGPRYSAYYGPPPAVYVYRPYYPPAPYYNFSYSRPGFSIGFGGY